MITEVKNFIETFLQAELDAKNAHLGTDQEIRSNKVKAMYSFADQTLEDKLGLLIDRAPRNKKIRYAETRKLLKISHYTRGENYSHVEEKYQNLFLCFSSDLESDPDPNYMSLNLCYFVGKENGEYKIVMVYRLGEGFIKELEKDGYGWFLEAG